MKRIYIAAIDSILITAMFAGCSPTVPTVGNESLPSKTQNYQVEIINLTEPIYETIRTEKIDQPNCYGTGDVDNEINRTMGINHSIELGLGLTVDVDGKLELFGTGVDLGAAISSELGYQYGITESISRSITVRAAPKSHVIHTVKLSEVWESGTARVTTNGESIDIPFRSRANFSIDLLESAPVICPTEKATTISSGVVNISPTPRVNETVTVDANVRWVDSGILIQTGDQVKISYVSGQWGPLGGYIHEGWNCDSPYYSRGLMPTAPGSSLIAKIENNAPFCVGASPVFTSQYSGNLYFSFNDCESTGCFSDNTGSLELKVVIKSK